MSLFNFRRKQVKGKFSGKAMNDEIRNALKAEASPRIINAYRRVVANFSAESKVDFEVVVKSGPKIIQLTVKPKGNQLAVDRFNMLDTEGRKGGVLIVPKHEGGLLKFRSQYDSKTSANPARYGGTGRRRGALVRKKSVIQGAIEPRNFSEALEPAIKEEIQRVIRIAYKRVARRLG